MIAALAIVKTSSLSTPDRKRFYTYLAGGLFIPLATAIYLKIALGGTGVYLTEHPPASTHHAAVLNFQKTLLIAMHFLLFKLSFREWHGLWILFGAALLWTFLLRRRELANAGWWILAVSVLLIDTGYFLIFHISPFDLKAHMGWALIRLFLHPGAIALVFAFEVFGNRNVAT